jgi:hypothetical protein
VTFLLRKDEATDDISAEWESQAIMSTASLWKANKKTDFIKKLLPDIDIPDRELELDMSYMVGRSIPDELKAESE